MKCLKHLARSVKHLIRLDKQTGVQKKAILPSSSTEDLSEAERLERSNLETEDVCTGNKLSDWDEDANNKATRTEFTKHELSSKIETVIVKNGLKAKTAQDCVKIVNKLSYEMVAVIFQYPYCCGKSILNFLWPLSQNLSTSGLWTFLVV